MAVSNLVTTGGLATSDLVVVPQWTLIGSYTTGGNVASVTISSLPQTYRTLKIVAPQVTQPSNQYLLLRLNSNTNSIYQRYGFAEYSNQVTTTISGGGTSMYINGYNSSNNYSFDFIIENYSSSTDYKLIEGDTYYDSASGNTHEAIRGVFGSTTAITSINFVAGSGNMNPNPGPFTGGGIFVYGAK